MAVIDPTSSGRYLIGIECDGAAYHSARSARDRDRLRQAVLEGLGWRLHRIWSTAWFKNRTEEVERLMAAIQFAQTSPTAATQVPRQVTEANATQAPEIVPQASHQSPVENIKPYEFCQLDIHFSVTELHLVPTGQLVEWMAQVVAVESPVHWMEAGRRIADALGIQRLGNRIQGALTRACRAGSRTKRFAMRGEFLFTPELTQCLVL